MKLDKETVIKHQFWFLLGGFLLFWVIAVFWLKMAAADQITKVEGLYKKSEKDLNDSNRDPVCVTTFCPPWKQYGETFNGHKSVIWGKAWEHQKYMYDWPEALSKSRDMSVPQTDIPPDERDLYKNDLYKNEVKALKEWLPDLLGPIELYHGFDAIFQPQEWKETPTREEMWLAQEDFWVKRELFVDICNAVAFQSLMYPAAIDEKKEPKPEDVLDRFRFRNQNWEVTLHLRKGKKGDLVIGWDSTIKNVHPSGNAQPLISAKGTGIVFTLFQDSTRQAIEVQGEPVTYGAAQEFDKEHRDYPLKNFDWAKARDKDHLLGMSQSFDEATCPIRRIDALALGKQSCRTYTMPLQPNETLARLDAPKEDPNASTSGSTGTTGGTGAGGGMMGMGGGPGGMGSPNAPPGGGAGGMTSPAPGGSMMGGAPPGGMMGMAGGTAVNANPTPNNGIERNRYLAPPKKEGEEATDKPSRHLPVAIQVVVDQGHMQDVQMAIANSRLRIQITQVEFHHLKEYKPQTEQEKKGEGASPSMGPRGALFAPSGMSSMFSGQMQQQMQMQKQMQGQQMQQQMQQQKQMQMQMQGGMYGGMPMSMPNMPGMRRGGPRSMGPMTITRLGGMDGDPTAKNGKKKDQIDKNLVEMTVYGIATLYRRPDPKKTEETGQPAQAGTPAAPTAPAPSTAPAPTGGTPAQAPLPAPAAGTSGQSTSAAPAASKPDQSTAPANSKPTPAPPPPPPAGNPKP